MQAQSVPDLLAAARAAGATFRVLGAEIGVTNAAAVPPEVHAALKNRRDELLAHLAGDTRRGASAALLSTAGVEVAVAVSESEAAALVAEMLTDAGDGPLGLDMETAPHPEHTETSPAVRLTRTGAVARSQPAEKSGVALDPHRADPRLVQVYGGGRRCAVFDMRQVPWSALQPLWSPRLVIHNAQFELGFLRSQGIRPERFECTMQAAGLMLGVLRRSLAAAAEVYLDWTLPKDLQKSDWGAAHLSEEQIAYAALDAVVARRLWFRLARDLEARGRWDAYLIQRDAIPGAVAMEWAGIGVDIQFLNAEIEKWSVELGDARAGWVKAAGTAPPSKPAEVRSWLEQNLDPDTLASWPRTGKTRAISTKAEDLERAAHLPAIRPLLLIKALEKRLGSFGPSLRDAVNPVTRRIHPDFLVAGTKSGRWACQKPNMQQMPSERNAPGFRRVLRAAPGRVLIGADYSQMELRAAAEVSGDATLRQVYEDGQDLHALTAAATAGVAVLDVSGEQRDRAKPVNFGSIYGMGPPGLAAAAWNSYRIEMTQVEAQQALEAFFRKFHVLRTWMRRHADECQSKHCITVGVGRVVEAAWEPDGIRYTQACNLPVQGACADAMLRAVARVHARLEAEGLDAVLTAQIHDELIAEAHGDAAAVAAVLEEEMVAAFLETFPEAPTHDLVAVKVGETWADLK